jgi:hypothetical protein
VVEAFSVAIVSSCSIPFSKTSFTQCLDMVEKTK